MFGDNSTLNELTNPQASYLMCYDITTSGEKSDNPIGESAPNPASPEEQKQ